MPNSFTPGTTISSSTFNANFSDVGAEITGSLPRNGEAGMTGQFKAASGTAASPGLSFGSDTDSGLFLKSANTIGFAVGGVEVGTVGSTGFSQLPAFPTGTLMLFVQTNAPTGWTKFTGHNDKTLRVVAGTTSAGGSSTFSSVFSARTLTVSNLPAHAHIIPTHTHTFSATSDAESTDHTHSVSGTTSSDGAHTHTISPATVVVTGASTTSAGGGPTLTTASTSMSSAGAHTHTWSGTSSGRSASHTHAVNGTTAANAAGDTGSAGSGSAIDFSVQYVDVIIATKD